MFGRSIRLFEIFGFRVGIDFTWLFLALLIALSLAMGFFPTLYEGLPAATYWWMAALAIVGLFVSIVFHELSHSLVARRFGMEMRGITLFMFGGMAEMGEEPPTAKAEFFMAVAGPIASLFLAAIFYAVASLGAGADTPAPFFGVLQYLGLLNIVLAVFNLLPAFPLDGGRMLRAALWWWKRDLLRATRIASWIGGAFGLVIIALGIINAFRGNLVGGLWWFMIGIFLRAVARSSYHQLEMRMILAGQPVERLMTRDPVSVPPDLTVADLVSNYVYKFYHDLFPVVSRGRLLGSVGVREVKRIPREEWDEITVDRILAPTSPDNTVQAKDDVIQALRVMQRTSNTRLLVASNGQLAGVLALKDIMNLLTLRRELDEVTEPRRNLAPSDGAGRPA